MIETPHVGGDTLFANMEAAYDNLPQEIKEKIDDAYAVHDLVIFREALINQGKLKKKLKNLTKISNPTHPVVRTHPDTGKKSIYVNVALPITLKGFLKKTQNQCSIIYTNRLQFLNSNVVSNGKRIL